MMMIVRKCVRPLFKSSYGVLLRENMIGYSRAQFCGNEAKGPAALDKYFNKVKLSGCPALFLNSGYSKEIKTLYKEVVLQLNTFPLNNIRSLMLTLSRNAKLLPDETKALLEIVAARYCEIELRKETYKHRELKFVLAVCSKHNLAVKELIRHILAIPINEIEELDTETTIYIASYMPIIKQESDQWSELYHTLMTNLDKNMPKYLSQNYKDTKALLRISQLFEMLSKTDGIIYPWTDKCIGFMLNSFKHGRAPVQATLRMMNAMLSLPSRKHYELQKEMLHTTLEKLTANYDKNYSPHELLTLLEVLCKIPYYFKFKTDTYISSKITALLSALVIGKVEYNTDNELQRLCGLVITEIRLKQPIINLLTTVLPQRIREELKKEGTDLQLASLIKTYLSLYEAGSRIIFEFPPDKEVIEAYKKIATRLEKEKSVIKAELDDLYSKI